MTATVPSIGTAAARLRRVRGVLVAASRRKGPVRCSWTVALLAGLWFLL